MSASVPALPHVIFVDDTLHEPPHMYNSSLQSLTSRLPSAALVRRKMRGSSAQPNANPTWRQHGFSPMRRSYNICLAANNFVKPQTQHLYILRKHQAIKYLNLNLSRQQKPFIHILLIPKNDIAIQHLQTRCVNKPTRESF